MESWPKILRTFDLYWVEIALGIDAILAGAISHSLMHALRVPRNVAHA